MKNHGRIKLQQNFVFEWSRVSSEINGMVLRPNNTIVGGTAGFYRCDQPEKLKNFIEDELIRRGEITP